MKFRAWLLIVASLMLSTPAYAVGVKNNGVMKGQATDLDFDSNFTVSGDGAVKTISNSSTSATQILGWSPDEFMIAYHPGVDSAFSYQPLSTSSTPSLLSRNGENTGFIRWADGNDTPIQKVFRVPDDYGSGGYFRVVVGKSNNTGVSPALDYQVFINSSGAAIDTTATNQSTSQLDTTLGVDSPETKTLTITTDFGSLVAGNIVTLELWRDDVNTSTADLELYYVEFVYSKNAA